MARLELRPCEEDGGCSTSHPQPNSEPNSNRGYNLTFCFLTQNYDLGQEPVHGKEDHWESYI